MNNEQIPFAKTAITRIVIEKIPKAKGWTVSKDWIDSLSKEQFEAYLDRLRLLNRILSDQEAGVASNETGTFILFGSYPPTEIKKQDELARIGGEAAAYLALALWRILQLRTFLTSATASSTVIPFVIQ
jgi:hypothetical protein